jgi:hypothetical protein
LKNSFADIRVFKLASAPGEGQVNRPTGRTDEDRFRAPLLRAHSAQFAGFAHTIKPRPGAIKIPSLIVDSVPKKGNILIFEQLPG